MKMKKLLTAAALLSLGVAAGAGASHEARIAWAQSGESTAEPVQGKSPEGTPKSQGAKQGGESTAEPELGTRGESGRAGPVPPVDAGPRATEPDKGNPSQKSDQGGGSDKGSESGPHSNKFQQNKSGGDRDPIPPGTETASPTQRQSRPW